jgi:hypothetical protein
MTALCAKETAGFDDVERTLPVKAGNVAVGQRAPLHGPPRARPQSRAIAVIQLRARNSLHRAQEKFRVRFGRASFEIGFGCVGAELPTDIVDGPGLRAATTTHPQLVAGASLGEGRRRD